ncbi:hypothetical protein I6I10_02145 [Corynebacterium glucuronolyticum]|uniref:Uncharacterized protein n=1 Tax=Corynebacterium glucuronolyticum TaxID=39791 RepID=A0A7T4EG45_9CORY|nr:hypothetical protein [Corynebacterium glucuronolyticum]QQB46765.1 hypothetical protein I6I10_02145 [Corynebacterium glucuronolyticum]WKD62409.1 hypothetical protein CGLUCO_00580 [Corynebacterium glucuronolyticum DSM 44120]SMB81589.1 hypothetical protein SAMN05660745_02451 [Corynebacterium glucuronolyticum]
MHDAPKRIAGEQYFHRIAGDTTVNVVDNIFGLRAVITKVDRVTNEPTGID